MAHILAVDDDPDLCTLLKTALERDGHAVEIRTSGVTVTESLCRWADCILLDVMMPGEDGFATCRRIRAITQAPILFLTARTDEQSVLTGLGIGADDYLTKPFEFEELAARIRALLRRRSPEKTDAVSVGDLTVEFSTRRVIRGGKEINLSSKEFALLESLIRHKGAVLSRTQLENQVWDYGFEGGSNIVDVYIRYLRKKLDDPFEKKLIHTIRGAGYTLREE